MGHHVCTNIYLERKRDVLTRKQFVIGQLLRGEDQQLAREQRCGTTKNLWFADNSTSRCPYEIFDEQRILFLFFPNNLPRYTIPRYLCVTRISVETWTKKKQTRSGRNERSSDDTEKRKQKIEFENDRKERTRFVSFVPIRTVLHHSEPINELPLWAFLHYETCCWISIALDIYINAHTIIARTVYLLCSILAFNYLILSIGSIYTAVRLQVESFPIYRAIVRW